MIHLLTFAIKRELDAMIGSAFNEDALIESDELTDDIISRFDQPLSSELAHKVFCYVDKQLDLLRAIQEKQNNGKTNNQPRLRARSNIFQRKVHSDGAVSISRVS